MKNIKNYLFAIAVAALAVAACDKTTVPAYENAPAISSEQVFFPASVGDQIKMADGETSFIIPVQRGTANLEAIDVEIAASGEGIEFFTVPGTVSFAANAKTADLVINITDPVALGKNVFKELTLSIADESMTTPYGRNSITFTAGVELPWIKFDDGTYYSFWTETELERTVEYQQISENMRYCRIQNFWDDEDNPMDIFWYWDTTTDNCFVLPTILEPYDGENNCVMSDMASFYTKYQGWEGDVGAIGSDQWFAWAGPWMKNRGDIPYYDGNGTFHLADWFYIAATADGVPTGRGWSFGGGEGDWFKGNSFGDYTLALAYKGMFVNTKTEAFPVIEFSNTKESAKYYSEVKYLIIPQSEDPDQALETIVAGESEDIQTVTIENLVAEIQPVLEPGDYYLVAVPYVKGDKNDKGEPNEYKTIFAQVLKFTFTGLTSGKTVLKEGSYDMACSISGNDFASTFTITATDEAGLYCVTSLGIPNGAEWYAYYDADALTLTLNGYEFGYEKYGNQFGSLYGYFNAEKTQVYALCAYDTDESDGSDNLVININASGEPESINQTFTVEVYGGEGFADLLGYYGYYHPALTTITPSASSAPKQGVVKMAGQDKVGKVSKKVNHETNPRSSVSLYKLNAKGELITFQE